MSTKLTVQTLLANHGESLVARLPKGMESDRFKNSIRAAVAGNPKLTECIASNPASFLTECARAATMGLEVGDVFGHFYLVPFKNNRQQTTDTVGIVGYKGLLELARRHPQVAKITAHPVYEGETFDYNMGEDEVSHHWDWDVDRSESRLKGVYCQAILVHPITGARERVIQMLSRGECDAIKKRSKGADRTDSPWNTNYVQMCLKSVIRRAINSGKIPMAAEVMLTMQHDADSEHKPAEVVVTASGIEDPLVATSTVRLSEPNLEVPDLDDVEKKDLQKRLKAAQKEAGLSNAELLSWGAAGCPSAKLAKKPSEWTVEELREIVPALEEENAKHAHSE